LFFSGSMDDYFKLYSETARTIKSVNQKLKVGGPATAGNAWIKEMIGYCSANKVPIDFISTHTYGVKQGFLDQTGDVGVIVSPDKKAVWSDMVNTRQIIRASAMPNLELHYTEWSSSYTPTDPLHDSYHEAAYILDKVKHAGAAVNSMSYWTFTDIFEELGPRATPFHGGFGLVNYEDILKPAFYAFQFLNRLGDTELGNTDGSSIACTDQKGNVQVLFWDFSITHPGDLVNDQQYYNRNLPSKPAEPVNLILNNVDAGRYKVQVYKEGYLSNDAYTTYLNMGSPSQLTRPQVQQLKKASSGMPVWTGIITIKHKGIFERKFAMHQNDVFFLDIRKI